MLLPGGGTAGAATLTAIAGGAIGSAAGVFRAATLSHERWVAVRLLGQTVVRAHLSS